LILDLGACDLLTQ